MRVVLQLLQYKIVSTVENMDAGEYSTANEKKMKHFVAFGNFWVYSDTVSAVFLVPSERHSLVVVLRSFRDGSAGCDRARPLCDDDRSLFTNRHRSIRFANLLDTN